MVLNIIPEMLNDLNNSRKNYPSRLLNEFYQNNKDRIENSEKDFAFNTNPIDRLIYDETCDWANKKWGEILNRMIFLFSECRNNDDYDYKERCLKETFDLFTKYFNDLWW